MKYELLFQFIRPNNTYKINAAENDYELKNRQRIHTESFVSYSVLKCCIWSHKSRFLQTITRSIKVRRELETRKR